MWQVTKWIVKVPGPLVKGFVDFFFHICCSFFVVVVDDVLFIYFFLFGCFCLLALFSFVLLPFVFLSIPPSLLFLTYSIIYACNDQLGAREAFMKKRFIC